MAAGQSVSWHRADVQISVFVERGSIDFGTRMEGSEQMHRLNKSMFITLAPKVDHCLHAHEDAVMLVYKTPNPALAIMEIE